MATQWTGVLAQHVSEQRDGIRSKDDSLSAFDLCVAVASRLDCPLSVRSEYIDKEGGLRAASITIPEEHDDTDADVAAAALVAATSKSDTTRVSLSGCANMLVATPSTVTPHTDVQLRKVST